MDGAVAQKKGIDIKSILGGLVALMILIFGIAMAATIFGFLGYGEPTPVFAGDRDDIVCAAWEDAPAGYQEKITKAANAFKRVGEKVRIQPALLGAIFLSEQGNTLEGGTWPSKAVTDTDWAQGGDGVGPFQIEKFENKWKTISEIGLAGGKVYPAKEGEIAADPQNFDDAALAAGGVLYEVALAAGIPLDTINQNEVQCLAAGYNGGPDMCKRWKNDGYSTTNPPATTNQYHLRAWASFQQLYNVGCQSVTGGDVSKTGNAIVDTAMNEVKLWRGSYDDRVNDKSSDSYGRYSPENNCPVIYFDGTVLPTKYSCGSKWCGIFVSWVYTKAGYPLNVASTEGIETFFATAPHSIKRKSGGITPNDLSPGDVIRISKYDSHVGIVVGMATNGKVQTIEGNVGNDTVKAYTENSPSGDSPYVNISDIDWVGKW